MSTPVGLHTLAEQRRSHRVPWPSLPHALLLLRVTVAGLFLAHAVVRVLHGTIPQFGAFLSRAGLPAAVPL
ncbi:MAG: hypothetical protein MUF00_00320, partial [Gemmatimonadaceae bacterium]|nr:hypothetical protein [Gemmatimonadaceae bacterium]